jgi:hypothetical protein
LPPGNTQAFPKFEAADLLSIKTSTVFLLSLSNRTVEAGIGSEGILFKSAGSILI